jgi:hypothetical protein
MVFFIHSLNLKRIIWQAARKDPDKKYRFILLGRALFVFRRTVTAVNIRFFLPTNQAVSSVFGAKLFGGIFSRACFNGADCIRR